MKLLLALLVTLCMSVGAAFAAVNINTATEAELQALEGIGPTRAKAIVEYRTKNGPFKSVDDLQKVPGIGAGTLNNIRKDVSLTGSTSKPSDAKSSAKGSKDDKSSRSSGTDAKRDTTTMPESKGAQKSTREADTTAKKDVEKSSTKSETKAPNQKETKQSGSAKDDTKGTSSK